MNRIVECVPNFSEGRDAAKVEQLVAAIAAVPDVVLLAHELDANHHRSVITFAGEPEAVVEAAVRAAAVAVELIDLNHHLGEHPRIGALDVLPFVPLQNVTMEDCVELAHQAGERLARELHIPVYLYERAATRANRVNLADVRRGEFEGLREEIETEPNRKPDYGEPVMHPTAGATAVGARAPLIAYNINLGTADLNVARKIAQAVRGSSGGLQFVKALPIDLKDRGQVQVSMNLVNYEATPLFRAFELVRREAERYGVPVVGSEIVGLVPQAALNACADFYLRCENFREGLVLEKRLQEALAERASRTPVRPGTLHLMPPVEAKPVELSSVADEFFDESAEAEWLGTFLDDVAAGTLAPGGGSVTAYAGALAATLGTMVCNLTLGKKKYEEVEQETREILEQLEQIGLDLRVAVAEDADSQERMVEAMQLPRGTEAERLARTSAIEQATRGLIGLRMRVAESAFDTIELLDELAEVGNLIAFADLTTGAQLALTALRSTSYQVLSNLGAISDEEFTRQRRAELDDLIARGQEVADGIETQFFQMYPR
jgi:glutamate formiminotransferase / formiminotetrahydrofolate cyclodeaminase